MDTKLLIVRIVVIKKRRSNSLAQTLTYYPLGNAQTILLKLSNEKKMLFDFADVKSNDPKDKRWNLKNEFDDVNNFDVVMFTHAHEDHIKGAADFFRMEYSRKRDNGATIGELWLSSAFVTDTSCTCEDASVIRQEARERLKAGEAVKVFGHGKSLTKWLNNSGISEETVESLIFHAGQNIPHDLGDEVSFFLHAPFSDDCDDVDDKNDPSVVMQMRLYNFNRETNILLTGDTPYDVLDEIVQRTLNNKNKEYLYWDLYDIPHHCSNTGLCDSSSETIEPTNNIEWLLKQSGVNAFIVASCKALAEADSPPPSTEAAEAYQNCINSDVEFLITMEFRKANAPEPMVFTIDSRGLKLKPPALSAHFNNPAPRAG